jgi:general secretion pathway protein G
MKTDSTYSEPRQGRLSDGFTLVEMLLVLMILTLLAAIVYPKIPQHHRAAQIKAAIVQLKAFDQALEMYELNTGHFPQSRDGLLELVNRPANSPNWNGPYLDHIPKDPWGNDYVYVYPGKHRHDSYDLMSYGEDGPAGSGEGINNWQPLEAQAGAK